MQHNLHAHIVTSASTSHCTATVYLIANLLKMNLNAVSSKVQKNDKPFKNQF